MSRVNSPFFSPFSYQRDYKQELKKLDKHNIINFNMVNMGTSNVNTYLNNLSLDSFLNILYGSNQFDRNEINKLLEEKKKNSWSKRYQPYQVYRHVIENPNEYKKSNRRSNGKNNKKYNNARKNGELKGELGTIKISLSNKNSNFSKKLLRGYERILEFHERRLRNTRNNVSKKEKEEISMLLRNIKIIMEKKEEKNRVERKNTDDSIKNFRVKLNNLIDNMEKSKRKYTITIRQPTSITKSVLESLQSKVNEVKKEANKPAAFGKTSKSVSKASEAVLIKIDELLKNKSIPQSGGGKKYIINPLTGRKILKNGPTAIRLNL